MEPQKTPLHALFQLGTKRSLSQKQYEGLFTRAGDVQGRKHPSRAAVLRQSDGYSPSCTSTKVAYRKTPKTDQKLDLASVGLSEVVPASQLATHLSFSHLPPQQTTSDSSSLVSGDSGYNSPFGSTRLLHPQMGNLYNVMSTPASGMLQPHKGFKCDYPSCNAAPFQTQYLLNAHNNVHSQLRPHYCPVPSCPRGEGGKGFKRKNEMIRHGLVHASPGYICPFCPDREHKYPRPDNLQRHVRVHHVDKDKDDPQLRDVLAQRPQGPQKRRRNTDSRQAHDLLHSPASAAPDITAPPPNYRDPTLHTSRESSVNELSRYRSSDLAEAVKNQNTAALEIQHKAVTANHRRTAVDEDHSETPRRLGYARKRMEYTISQDMTISDAARRKVTLSALEDRKAARCTKRIRHIFRNSGC